MGMWRIGLLVLGIVVAAGGCSSKCDELPAYTACVIGTPGTRCGDVATPASCDGGKWVCPPGQILSNQCGPADAGR
jgi:hypothetical protein